MYEEDPGRKKAAAQAYYDAHREERKTSFSSYYDANKERKASTSSYYDAQKGFLYSSYYDAHKEVSARSYCDAHKEGRQASLRIYYDAHKHILRYFRIYHCCIYPEGKCFKGLGMVWPNL